MLVNRFSATYPQFYKLLRLHRVTLFEHLVAYRDELAAPAKPISRQEQ